MTFDFFESFCNKLQKPLHALDCDKRIFIFLEELIFQKSDVYISLSEDKISEFVKGTTDNFTEIQLQRLSAVRGKIKTCKDEIEIIRQKKFDQFNSLSIKPDFIFLSETKEYCKGISDELGIFCISKDFDFGQRNSFVQLQIIEKDEAIVPDALTSFLYKPNRLIIEDPHLFDKDLKGDFFCELIKALYPKNFQLSNFYITIICANAKDAKIENIKQRIEKEFPKIILRYYIRTKDSIHDRNIYSNTFWISCDYGFLKRYPKPTKWTYYPLGIYYPEFVKRTQQVTRFIQNEKQTTRNV